jgi:glycosyltransferase involved in cell wall biosynthesis
LLGGRRQREVLPQGFEMRIAFVCTHAKSIGGSYIHVRDVSAYLIKQGHEVKVFVGSTGPFTEQLEELRIPFHSLSQLDRPISPVQDFKAIQELKQVLKAFGPEIISCHSTKAGMVGRLAGHALGIPTLYTAHGWTFVEGIAKVQRILVKAIEKYCRPRGPRIICVCNDDKRIAIESGIGPENWFTVIHNGMPDAPERAKPSESIRIVSIARLDKQKDHPTLFEALATLKEIPWELDLVGGGPHDEQYRARVQALGIADQVHFHGAQKNVKPFLERAALFALITNYEGFPRSTLEAMRTGLPVIVTDVNGCREAIDEGKTGYTVPVKDPHTLANRLRELLTDPEKRDAFGLNAREKYASNFTFEIMIEKTKAVYSELLKRKI